MEKVKACKDAWLVSIPIEDPCVNGTSSNQHMSSQSTAKMFVKKEWLWLLEPEPRPISPRGLTWCQLRREPWRTLMMSTFKNRKDALPKSPPMLDFGNVLTILISTEFNVVALPFCKPYCFESEIPYCPPLKVPLLVFEKPLEHVLSGSNSDLCDS